MAECSNCGADVEATLTVYRDPRTGRDHRQHICPECGERMDSPDNGEMV